MRLTRVGTRVAPSVRLFGVAAVMLLASCGGGGSGSSASPPPNPAVSFTVQPTAIMAGQSATLTWSVSNASSCTASGAWNGSEPTSGTKTVAPTTVGANTFTLMCTDPVSGPYGGTATTSSMSVTLTVNGATAATAFVEKTLVADTASGSATVDSNLVNPWGIVFKPGAPVWVANNGTQTSTLYDGAGVPQPAGTPLIVHLPAGSGGAAFAPTGIVGNTTTDFMVSAAGKSGAAAFIFSGQNGMIAGWSPAVDASNAVVMYADTGGASYTGLALANNGSANFLYAADFHNNKVDVFNTSFTRQTPSATSFAFKDPSLPSGYAPFGIQALKTGSGGAMQIYVTYAKQQAPNNLSAMDGAGLGIVDIFDANGNFVKTLVPAGGALNAPWGIALAPADFGAMSNMLVVGNLGDGKINGYDPSSGQSMGPLMTASGPFAVPGLWGIAFGNDAASQPHNTLFYAAGTNDYANGVYGRIDLPAQ
jgi:uncharacterized protein (TIGR03118 family)